MGISFRRAESQILSQLAQRPQTLSMRKEQAGKATVITGSAFWGCPGLNFKAKLPFNEMREVFAALLKEIPTAQLPNNKFFNSLKCYIYFNLCPIQIQMLTDHSPGR